MSKQCEKKVWVLYQMGLAHKYFTLFPFSLPLQFWGLDPRHVMYLR